MSVAITVQNKPPPKRSGGVWDYISASRLNLWLRCGLAFKFRYVDGIRTPPTASLFVGKKTHDALEYLYRHRQMGIHLTCEQVLPRVTETWDQAVTDESIQFSSTDDEEKLKNQVIRLVEAYCIQIPENEPRPLAVETSLEAQLVDPATGEDLGIPLLGIVDLVLNGDEGPVIADFKTAARSTTPTEMQHEIQLGCYSYLYRQMTGQKEAGLEIRSLVKTKTSKINVHRFEPRDDRHFRRLFAVLRAYLEDLKRGTVLDETWVDVWGCDYRQQCAAWGG